MSTTIIYVGNLSHYADEQALAAAFSRFGEVLKVELPIDKAIGRARGFAFVYMSGASEADAAIAARNDSEFFERTLKLNLAPSDTESATGRADSAARPARPGSYDTRQPAPRRRVVPPRGNHRSAEATDEPASDDPS